MPYEMGADKIAAICALCRALENNTTSEIRFDDSNSISREMNTCYYRLYINAAYDVCGCMCDLRPHYVNRVE